MKKIESTHIIFDNKKIFISTDLVDTFLFLTEITKEIEILIWYYDKVEQIRGKFKSIINDFSEIAKILQDNNIDFKYTLTKDDMTIVDDLNEIKNSQIPRSQIICLFVLMETIFCLVTVYNYELSDEREIMEKGNDNIKKLINKYILTKKNTFYNKNISRFKIITADQIKLLRNTLTHFYSVSGWIGIIPKWAHEQAMKIEEDLRKKKENYIFFSPEDFYELLKSAMVLILLDRNEQSTRTPDDFKRKMDYVMQLVNNKAAKLLQSK